MRTIPPPKNEEERAIRLESLSLFSHKRNVTSGDLISRQRILQNFPVRTMKDFNPNEIEHMATLYKPGPIKIHDIDSVLKDGPYKDYTVAEVIERNPEWLLWAIRNVRGFYVQDMVMGAAQTKMEEVSGETKACK